MSRTRRTWDQQRGTRVRDLETSHPNTLRGCVDAARSNVNQAYDLMNPKINILPQNITNAKEFLESAWRDIEYLEELLQEDPPHSEYGRIIDQVRIITDEINLNIVPHLKQSMTENKNIQDRFVQLLKALNKLDTLIPK